MFKTKKHKSYVAIILLSVAACFSKGVYAESSVSDIKAKIKADALSSLKSYATQQGWKNTVAETEIWLPEPWIEANPCQGQVGIAKGRSTQPWGRVSYEIECSNPQWHTRARATLSVKTQMAIAQKSLRRGDVITAQDVVFEQRSMDRVYTDILSDIQAVKGKRVLRSLRANSVIPEQSIAKPYFVEKDAPVNIQIDTMGIQATMKGIALENGSMTERVSVRNNSSGKTISATVSGKNTVTVSF